MVIFTTVATIVAAMLFFGVRQALHSRKPAPAAAVVTSASPAPAMPASAAAADGMSAAQTESDSGSVKVEQSVVKFYFAWGKADLAAGAPEALSDVIERAKEGRKLIVSGFHDPSGNAARNVALARQRAVAVQDALRASGVAASQIELKMPEQLGAAVTDAEARRVEIRLR